MRTNPAWRLSSLPLDASLECHLKYEDAVCSDSDEDLNVEALLRSLGVRPPHQAQFTLDAKDVLSIRASVVSYCLRHVHPPKVDDMYRGIALQKLADS